MVTPPMAKKFSTDHKLISSFHQQGVVIKLKVFDVSLTCNNTFNLSRGAVAVLETRRKNKEMKLQRSKAGISRTHCTNWEGYHCHATLLCKLFMPHSRVTTKKLTE